jgi:tRNA pseudouridine38-40 synthase
MPRYKLTIEYDGTAYFGWQVQDHAVTVQGELMKAVEAFSGERAAVNGAGRTDTGVHALGQVAHLDLAKAWESDVVRDAINAQLRPNPIAVISAERVANDFEARYGATKRHYLYRLIARRADLALERDRVWRVPRPVNVEAMHEAAQRLVGKHDFTTFRATECQAKSPVKTLDQLDVARVGNEIHVTASARSFLHHQVRSMVGTLVQVGDGKMTADDIARVLAACDRTQCGPVAPSCGLYLVKVDY